VSWDTIDCENAKPCPSGNSKDCPKKQQCFSGAPCAKEDSSGTDSVANVAENTTAVENDLLSNEPEEEVTTFCGLSWGNLIENCDDAKPCPSGTNADCPTGQSCFANACSTKPSKPEITSLGHYNFAAMVGEIPAKCEDSATMSRNVGYWQSWSIYRDENCNLFEADDSDILHTYHILICSNIGLWNSRGLGLRS